MTDQTSASGTEADSASWEDQLRQCLALVADGPAHATLAAQLLHRLDRIPEAVAMWRLAALLGHPTALQTLQAALRGDTLLCDPCALRLSGARDNTDAIHRYRIEAMIDHVLGQDPPLDWGYTPAARLYDALRGLGAIPPPGVWFVEFPAQPNLDPDQLARALAEQREHALSRAADSGGTVVEIDGGRGGVLILADRSRVTVASQPPAFVCPACERPSQSAEDAAHGYCGACHWYTGNPTMAWARPELFTEHGKPAPTAP